LLFVPDVLSTALNSARGKAQLQPFESIEAVMAKTVFTFSESSSYDDQPEVRYHFPSTYLAAAHAAIGDWVVYYEPRRTTGPNSATGRQAYFATAFVTRVVGDESQSGFHYAYVRDYTEFEQCVPFHEGERYYESALVKSDGSTNKGAFGRSVRTLPEREYREILALGFTRLLEPWELNDGVDDVIPNDPARPLEHILVSRKFRDASFRRHVRSAYGNRCAMTGLQLINGGGRPEVQAAHIKPVEVDGPDTIRNGLALTGTFHWLFDRGLVSIGEDYRILVSSHGLPDDLGRLLPSDGRLRVPERPEHLPHPAYSRWHREHRFDK
jgi:putative restriction endonuclease